MSVQRFVFKPAGTTGSSVITSTPAELTALAGVTATATELNTLASVTPGTVTAGKAVVTTTGKTVDALNVTALSLATVAVGSTATEINLQCDQSVYSEALTALGAVTMSLTKRVHTIDTTLGAQTCTPAAPGAANIGVVHVVVMGTDGGTDSVFTLTNVSGVYKTADAHGAATGATATFNDAGDTLVLVGASATKWMCIGQYGVTVA